MALEQNGNPAAVIDMTTSVPAGMLPAENSTLVLPPGAAVEAAQPPTFPANAVAVFDQVQGIDPRLVGPVRWDHPQAAHVKILDRAAGQVERTRSKVCIVGYAENSRHMALYDDPDCEIWGVNQLYRFIPRADRWFQIHTDWTNQAKWVPGTDLAAWLREAPIPVYMSALDPTIPNSLTYPKAHVMAGLNVHDYFTSSIAYMLALAIAEGFTTIGIYGIDLIIGREYFFEKACVEFYLGIAHARGITYHTPEACALLWQSHAYGYEQEPDYGFYGLAKLHARSEQLKQQVQKLRDDVNQQQGQVDEALWLLGRIQGDKNRAGMQQHVDELQEELGKRLNRLYLHDGACQEVSRMHEILEIKTRGGQVS